MKSTQKCAYGTTWGSHLGPNSPRTRKEAGGVPAEVLSPQVLPCQSFNTTEQCTSFRSSAAIFFPFSTTNDFKKESRLPVFVNGYPQLRSLDGRNCGSAKFYVRGWWSAPQTCTGKLHSYSWTPPLDRNKAWHA